MNIRCPHCLHNFSSRPEEHAFKHWKIELHRCSNSDCDKDVLYLCSGELCEVYGGNEFNEWNKRLVYPQSSSRPVPSEVPKEIAQDFTEACNVLPVSPKASAALSRRCLQHILNENGYSVSGINERNGNKNCRNLYGQIEAVIKASGIPSYILDQLHPIRDIGNSAAHPMRSEDSGIIFEVETDEAEWMLDVLETLFDFFYVQPEKSRQKQARRSGRLLEAGRLTQ